MWIGRGGTQEEFTGGADGAHFHGTFSCSWCGVDCSSNPRGRAKTLLCATQAAVIVIVSSSRFPPPPECSHDGASCKLCPCGRGRRKPVPLLQPGHLSAGLFCSERKCGAAAFTLDAVVARCILSAHAMRSPARCCRPAGRLCTRPRKGEYLRSPSSPEIAKKKGITFPFQLSLVTASRAQR